MRVAIEELDLDILIVVYPGKRSYRLDDSIVVVPLEEAASTAIGSV